MSARRVAYRVRPVSNPHVEYDVLERSPLWRVARTPQLDVSIYVDGETYVVTHISDTTPQVSVPASFPRLAGSSVTVADRDTGGFPATSADVPGPAPTLDATPVPCRVSPIPAALPPRGGGSNSQPERTKEQS